ncbi:MAG: thiamine diphosphokinase [Lachnospiraceae bacterium]|nr:thiamine diphosphokinase [Lachnospiraceae bacterium]
MNRIIIITGGSVNIDFARQFFEKNEYEYVIAVDGGLKYLHEIGIKPDCLVGDFDTIDDETLNLYLDDKTIEVIKLIPEKDYTDTHTAMLKAIELESKEICILGGIGTRIDHTISNIQLLFLTLNSNIKARIVNENNNIYLVNRDIVISKSEICGKYISLIPINGNVKGVTLKGFKYELNNYDFDPVESVSLGVSNELVEDIGQIFIEDGILLLVEAKD